jgi:hypothetical protein
LNVNNNHDQHYKVSDYLNQTVSNSEWVSDASEQKIKDVISMFPYIQPHDVEFYNSLPAFKDFSQELANEKEQEFNVKYALSDFNKK